MRTNVLPLPTALLLLVATAGACDPGDGASSGALPPGTVAPTAENCGTEPGLHETRCQALCDASKTNACSDEDGLACLDEYRARTNSLNVECAACVIDHSRLGRSLIVGVPAECRIEFATSRTDVCAQLCTPEAYSLPNDCPGGASPHESLCRVRCNLADSPGCEQSDMDSCMTDCRAYPAHVGSAWSRVANARPSATQVQLTTRPGSLTARPSSSPRSPRKSARTSASQANEQQAPA